MLYKNIYSYLNDSLGGLTFGKDSNGKWGYKIGGAGSVIPFSNGGLVSDYMELIIVVGYADRNSDEPYASEVFRHIIYNKNNISDQKILSGSAYYSSGWRYTINTKTTVKGEFNFKSNASTPRSMNIWGRIAWI